MQPIRGLHHVTAISGPAQENLDFYVGVLGMRLVKKSVNQDDTGTYHLFYADAEGRPGTDLTFFPWAEMAPPRRGHGLADQVALAVPPASLDFWRARLGRYGVETRAAESRFGETTLPLVDPHGLSIALVASEDAMARPFTPWEASEVPAERQVRGLHGARTRQRDLAPTRALLENGMGFRLLGEERGWERWAVGDDGSRGSSRGSSGGSSGTWIDLAAAPDEPRGAWGTGAIHHLAWRVDDLDHQREVRAQVEAAGSHPTPVIDRFWFQSVYFKEPGGVLFELATDGPGFAVDESPEHLGEALVLPPWLEGERAAIEAKLPRLTAPKPAPLVS